MAERIEIGGPGRVGILRRPKPFEAWRTVEVEAPDSVRLDTGEYVLKSAFEGLSPTHQAFIKKHGVGAFNVEQEKLVGASEEAYEEAVSYAERERVQQEEWMKENVIEVGPEKETILRTVFEDMEPAAQKLIKEIGLVEFNRQTMVRFEASHTQLPDGQWIDNKQLAQLETEAPNIHKALTTSGFVAADKIVQDQQAAFSTLKGYEVYPFSEALMWAAVKAGRYTASEIVAKREAEAGYDIKRYIADHPEVGVGTLLTAGFTQAQIDEALKPIEALGTEYAGFVAGQAHSASILSKDYIPTVEEYRALNPKMTAGELTTSYEEKYGNIRPSTGLLGAKSYPGGKSVWEYENIPTSLATRKPDIREPELTQDQFIKNYYKDKGWDISVPWATPQVQAQYKEAKEAYQQYKIAETGIVPKKDFLIAYYKDKGWDTSEVESVLQRVVFAMTPEMQAIKDRQDEAEKAYQQTGGEPAISHDTYVAQYLTAVQGQGIEPTEDMRIAASRAYYNTYGFTRAIPLQMVGMATRAGFPSARLFYPEYKIEDIKWYEHLITAVNVAAITSPLWLPPVARAIGKVLPKGSVVTEAQVTSLADDVLRWGEELFKARGNLATTRVGTTAFTKATQVVQYAEVQYSIASSSLEKLLLRAYMTPSSIPGQLSLQDIANMRYMRLGMAGKEFPLEVYGKVFSGIGPPTVSPVKAHWTGGRLNPYPNNKATIDSIMRGERYLGMLDSTPTAAELSIIRSARLTTKGMAIYNPNKVSLSAVDDLINLYKSKPATSAGALQQEINLGKALGYTNNDIAAQLKAISQDWQKYGFTKAPYTLDDILQYAPEWYEAAGGKALTGGMGAIAKSPQETITLVKSSPRFAQLSPAEQAKLLLAIDDYYKSLETGISGYMIAPDEIFYQTSALTPPVMDPGRIPRLPPTGVMLKAHADIYPGYFAGGESGLLAAPGGKWAPFAKGTTQTLISPFIVPTGEITVTTASGARVIIRSPGPGTGVTGTAVVASTRTMTPDQLAKLQPQIEFIPYIVYETTPEGLVVPKIMYYPVAVPLPGVTPITGPAIVPATAPAPSPTIVPIPASTPGPTIKTITETEIVPALEPAIEPTLEPAVSTAALATGVTTVAPALSPTAPPAFPPPTPPPPIILIPRGREGELKVTARELAEGVTFRQGLIWIVKLPPLIGIGNDNVYTMDAPPPSQVYRADVGLPRETVSGVRTGAKPLKGDFTIPWGLFDIHYKDGTLEYLPSGKTPMEIITEKPIVTKESSIPAEDSTALEFEVEKKERLRNNRRKSVKPIRARPQDETHPGLRHPKLEPPSLKEIQL